MAKMNKKLITLLHTLPSMGMAFIVLGVLLMVASFAFSIKGNNRTLRRSLFHPGRNSRICIFIKKRISRSPTYPFYIFENLFPITESFNLR